MGGRRRVQLILGLTLLLLLLLPLLSIPFIVAQAWFFRPPGGYVRGLDVFGLLVRPLLISAMTILGILSKTLYDGLSADKSDESLSIFLRRALRSRALWAPMLVSPMVIIAFYKTIAEAQSEFLLSLMAYENGFFFRSILEGKK